MKKTYYLIILFAFVWSIWGSDSCATDNNEDLEALRIDIEGMVPSFNKDITEYYITVGENINQIEVTAIPRNENAFVNVEGNEELKSGINKIEIIVKSEDGTREKKYIINVTKTSNEQTANTNLETLAIENVILSPEFNNSVTEYNAEIANTVSRLNILAIPENVQTQVRIEGEDKLQEGENVVTIKVIAQNGITERVYRINVYKRNNGEEVAEKQEQEAKIARVSAVLSGNEIDNNKEAEILEMDKGERDNKIIAILIVFSVILVIIIIRNRKK